MQLTLKYSLPFVVVTLTYRGADVEIPHTLVDTGSAKTMFAADTVAQVGLIPEPQDTLVTVRGVGGAELVFTRVVDRIRIGQQSAERFEIEVGGMDYGFEINGILGMDFLTQTGAVIDVHRLQIRFPVTKT